MADAGGILEGIRNSAHLAIAGIPPEHYLNESDPLKIHMWDEIAKEVRRIRDIERDNLAKAIAAEVSKLFKK